MAGNGHSTKHKTFAYNVAALFQSPFDDLACLSLLLCLVELCFRPAWKMTVNEHGERPGELDKLKKFQLKVKVDWYLGDTFKETNSQGGVQESNLFWLMVIVTAPPSSHLRVKVTCWLTNFGAAGVIFQIQMLKCTKILICSALATTLVCHTPHNKNIYLSFHIDASFVRSRQEVVVQTWFVYDVRMNFAVFLCRVFTTYLIINQNSCSVKCTIDVLSY